MKEFVLYSTTHFLPQPSLRSPMATNMLLTQLQQRKLEGWRPAASLEQGKWLRGKSEEAYEQSEGFRG
ncbi:hypothetical protein V6Z11_A09G020600 [Gossypium hirsutum]